MKFVVTGAAGHVSKPLTELLLKKGHDVTVVGRSPKNLEGLVKLGAKTAIGDMGDVPFLTETFKRADGVYLMLPPMWDSDDQKKQSIRYAENFSSAIRANGVKNAVFLSSYGAHRLDDAGAISGLGLAEVVLNKLDGVNVLSLRAGYFYSNLLLSLDLVKTAGHIGNMFAIPDGTFTMVDPDDIARVAAEALDKLNFKGHTYIYVISDLSGTDEIASLIGKEIGIPDLKWVKFPAEDFKKVLLNYGFADGAASDYVEMFATLDTGLLFEDIQKTKPKVEGTSIEGFAKAWAAAYR
jgi:uncharacterized protein YbjT (DUF2867 family)